MHHLRDWLDLIVGGDAQRLPTGAYVVVGLIGFGQRQRDGIGEFLFLNVKCVSAAHERRFAPSEIEGEGGRAAHGVKVEVKVSGRELLLKKTFTANLCFQRAQITHYVVKKFIRFD